jgi:two-component system chemotaxis response regulator CheB
MPGICIVQHIPPVFSKAFAKRLDEISALSVKEAEEGDEIRPGLVLVAPGNYHMKMIKSGVKYQVTLTQTPPVWHQRPAVDILFQSAVNLLGRTAVAALLTGMGKDGANGLLALKEAGAYTIAQEASTCIVYGMPKTAVELGAATDIIGLKDIPEALIKAVSMHSTPQYTHA